MDFVVILNLVGMFQRSYTEKKITDTEIVLWYSFRKEVKTRELYKLDTYLGVDTSMFWNIKS